MTIHRRKSKKAPAMYSGQGARTRVAVGVVEEEDDADGDDGGIVQAREVADTQEDAQDAADDVGPGAVNGKIIQIEIL
ncbi:hypothetical protein [Megasphaera sp.]|uniref:hypothetical protein n=1 Tax=Megasphaera sp. TaxID=2023260 RepID=UPI003A5B9379